MPKLPTVAIIGRPNTGKSTLFNRMVGSRRAIVSAIPGTTRDPVAQRIEGEKLNYLLMDTGGMGGGTNDTDFEDDVGAQALLALEQADLILFTINGREEMTAADHAVADALRKRRQRHVEVFLIVTKCDDIQKMEENMPQYLGLGIADYTCSISAAHNLGIDVLTCEIETRLSAMHFKTNDPESEDTNTMPRIAMVGKPNVGKSSLINALMPDKQRETNARLISDIPGTTRDTTDTVVRSHGHEYLLLDTAGLRKHSERKEGERDTNIEAYAALRTIQAIENADVTVLVLDATQSIARQDKRIANLAIERGTGLIILVNKIDLLPSEETQTFHRSLQRAFPFCKWAPVLFTSAKTRENLPKMFDLITSITENRLRRIETPVLNRWFQEIVARHQPKGIGGRSVRTKYITQADVAPPTFVLFLKNTDRLHFSTLRFMENQLRETFDLKGTPVRWVKKG